MAITTQYHAVGASPILGQREDLVDVISNVDYEETPFVSRIGRAEATALLHQWQKDSYNAATTTTQLEGLAFTEETPNLTSVLTNVTVIQKRNATVTGTVEAISKAGRASEMAYQVVKKGVELRRDMEATVLGQAEQKGMSSLEKAMQRVLDLHALYPGSEKSLEGKRPNPSPYAKPLEMPGMRNKDKLRGARGHVNLDVHEDHDDFVWKVLVSMIRTPEDEEKVLEHLRNVGRLYAAYFVELYQLIVEGRSAAEQPVDQLGMALTA